MVKRVVAIAFCLSLVVAGVASAQVHYVASVLGGYTWAEGVTGKDFFAPNGQTYNGASSTNSGMFGASFGVAEGHGEYGFLYRRQFGQLQMTGTATTIVGDMATDGYHGYFAYYFGDPDGKVTYYVMAGGGATHYAPVTFTPVSGGTATVGGRTQFSPTFGAGVRTMFSDAFGFRVGVQWTPTYLTVDQNRTYCDPYWGCYLQQNQYTSQVELIAGVTFRFGK